MSEKPNNVNFDPNNYKMQAQMLYGMNNNSSMASPF